MRPAGEPSAGAASSPTGLIACVCMRLRRNSVRLVIRKVQYAPEKPGPQPMVETTRSFLMSDRSLHLEASLDKEVHIQTHTPHANGIAK